MANFDYSKLRIEKLREDHDFSKFDCGDSDLNEFIQKDAYRQQAILVGTTNVCIYDENIIGYFTLLSDTIKANKAIDCKEEFRDQNITYTQFPAIKIGRFAINKASQKKSYGATILKLIVGQIAIEVQETVGCRFITVDAYPNSVGFYKKFGFKEMTVQRKPDENVPLYLDLYKVKKASGHSTTS